jgi:hypothetical protein
LSNVTLEETEGAGKAGAQCTRSLACESDKAHEHSHYRFTELVRLSLRNGFNAYNVLSPVTGLLPPSPAELLPPT